MISVRTVQNRKFKIHLNGLKLIINEKMSLKFQYSLKVIDVTKARQVNNICNICNIFEKLPLIFSTKSEEFFYKILVVILN